MYLRVPALILCLALNACAPVILGRTPEPAPPGETEVSLALGYPYFAHAHHRL